MKNLVTVIILFLLTFTTAFTQVNIFPATNGTDLEQFKYCQNGSEASFLTLNTITIQEQNSGDFSASGLLVLEAPLGWLFNTDADVFADILSFSLPPLDVSVTVTSVTTQFITLSLTVANTNVQEALQVNNVQVQAFICNSIATLQGNIEPSIFSTAGITGLTSSTNLVHYR